ncbi:MAG TPA: porin [Marinagarivorans sp.]
MKKQLSTAIALALCVPVVASAAPTLYGKANVSYASTKVEQGESEESILEVASNASRIGVKGAEAISDNLEAIYQAEFEVAFDDGETSDGNVFSKRNIFVGVKGGFGSVIVGHFDTPLKRAQKKVDLFNDLYGDIKHIITRNENRGSNSLMYSSPNLSGFMLYADLIASEQDNDAVPEGSERSNATSIAATYEANGFYGALAYDLDVEEEGSSAVRAVFQYNFESFQLGLLAEEYERPDNDKVSGIMASFQYKLNDWALKAQFGQSDIVAEDGTSFSLGADYKISKNTKLFGFYTNDTFLAGVDVDGNEIDYDANYLGLGMEVKF